MSEVDVVMKLMIDEIGEMGIKFKDDGEGSTGLSLEKNIL